jgi:hypothetical protein
METYKVGQAPWETQDVPSGSFPVGQAPWELPEKKPSFLKSMYKAIAEPVANIVARPVQLAQTLVGAKPIEGTYAGLDINNPQNVRDVIKDVGRGAETVALGIGGAGTVGAVKTGLKGLIAQGAKQEAKVGLQSGLLSGFGIGLEQASEQPPEEAFNTVFGSTALGGVLGTVGGAVLGSATPLVARGVSGVRKFANVGELQTKLSEGYQKILNPTAKQLKADKRFGNDSFQFLAKEVPDLPLEVRDGRIYADDAIEMAKQKYTAEATAYKPIIRNSGKYIDIDEVITKAKKQAKQEFDGSDLTRAEQQIEDEVNSFLRNTPQDVNVTANGKRFVALDRADDIKSYSWARGRGWGTPEAEVWNDTNNLIGHAFKDAIEKELPNAPIKAMNKRLGQWKNAIDMLERRNAQVSGSGGKLTKMVIKSVGTSVGAGLGGQEGIGSGVTGAGTGFLTATILANLIANPNVRLAVVRQLLKRLDKAGRRDMIQEAQDILQMEAEKYLLPSAGQSSFREATQEAIKLPQSARETNLGLDEVRGVQSNPIQRAMTEPMQAPTTQETINSNIPETIPPQSNNSIPNKQGGFSKIGLLASATGATALGATQIDGKEKETPTKQPIVQAETPKTPEDKATANAEKKYGIKFPKGFLKAVREQESSNKDNPKNLRLSMGLTDSAMKELGKDALPNTSIENVMQNSANYLALKSKLKKADGRVIDLTTPENQIKWYVQRYVGLLPNESRMINGEKVSYDKIYKSFEKLLAKYQ